MQEKTVKSHSALPLADSMTAKGIAIILMLFHHLFNDYEEYAGYTVSYFPFSGDRVMYLALLSKICVAIFVFISGYGIAASFEKSFARGTLVDKAGLTAFIKKRYGKLMAGYWFAFILTFICQPLGRTIFDAYGTGPKSILMNGLIDVMGLSFLFGAPTLNPTWWYMSVAIVIIITAPFVILAMRKFGANTALAISLVFLFVLANPGSITYYLVTMVIGIWCYETGLFESVNNFMARGIKERLLTIILEMAAFAAVMLLWRGFNYMGILDAAAALLVLLLTSSIFGRIPLISKGLAFLGKHSSNMFLMHNQLYSFYFLGFFYSFRHWLLIVAVLTAASLVLSIVMEWLKKVLRYDRWLSYVPFL